VSTHVRERLGEYLDGEISAEERSAMAEHLRECPDCRLLLEELAAVDDAARSLPMEAPDGYFETFVPRLRTRLRAGSRRAFRPPVWSLAVAAALLLAVITPLTLREHSAPAPRSFDEPAAVPPALRDRPASPDAPPLGQAVPRAVEPTGGAAAGSAVGAFAGAPAAEKERSEGALQERKEVAEPRRKKESQSTLAKDVAPAPAEQVTASAPAAPAAAAPVPAKAQADATRHADAAAGAPSFLCDGCVASPSPSAAARESAPPQLEAVSVSAAAPEAQPRALAKGRLSPGAVAVGRGSGGADRLSSAGEARYRTLRSRTPADAEEARELRLEWRAFAESELGAAHADDARVAAIEAAVQAYRFSASAADRATAAADGRAYLARSDAPQAERVRELLATLSDAP
jgi:hypothetical protein